MSDHREALCDFVRPYLHPSLAQSMTLDNTLEMETFLTSAFALLVLEPEAYASSFKALVHHHAASILSKAYRAHLMSRAAHFNVVSGFAQQKLCDAFVQSAPVHAWMAKLATVLAAEADRACPPDDTKAAVTNVTEVAESSSETSTDCPIINIFLKGPTLRDAWRQHASMRRIEEEACQPLEHNPDWMPGRDDRIPVFCGSPTATALCAQVAANAVVPAVPCLPVVWTTCSPLLCFVRCFFETEVLGHVDLTASSPLLDPQVFQLSLAQFAPSLSNEHQRAFVMPPRVAGQWKDKVQRDAHAFALDAMTEKPLIWSAMSDEPDQPWPAVLHCHASESEARLLAPCSRQLWQTVWYGDGITALNAARVNTAAISVTIFPRAPKRSLFKRLLCL